MKLLHELSLHKVLAFIWLLIGICMAPMGTDSSSYCVDLIGEPMKVINYLA